MDEEQKSLRTLFGEAVEIESPEQRAAYLQRVCGDNSELRQQIEKLIQAGERAGNFLRTQSPTMQGADPGPGDLRRQRVISSESAGAVIGRYKLLEKLGEGGFGEVWAAEQREPVKRRVALKIIKLGMDSKQVVARFEAERQALALMDHPNIAKVFDAGSTGRNVELGVLNDDLGQRAGAKSEIINHKSEIAPGRPYFVMELVRGIAITSYCDENQVATKERLDLFIKVCQAIQHAHQKGIIHRDIKPSNILVTLHDGVPVPKVIDFGIAKATQQELTDKTIFTKFQQFLGTPAYMSPEQAEMSGLDIDTRSDIYSLGVLLYELLTGKTPFDGKALLEAGLDEMRRTIRETEPRRPSTRLETLQGDDLTTTAKRRSADVNKLVTSVRGDLDWIVMKCLEKDRTRRYDTATSVALDIRRHLDNEPVTARPPSTAYRFQKAFRRNKLAFSAAAAVAISLLAGIGASSWQAVRAGRAEQQQIRLRENADNAREEAVTQRAQAAANAEAANAYAAKAAANEQRARRLSYVSDMMLAQKSLNANDMAAARRLLDRYRPMAGGGGSPQGASDGPSSVSSEDLRGWEWRYLWQFCGTDAAAVITRREGRIASTVSLSSDGVLLASGYADGRIEVWDLSNGLLDRVLRQEGTVGTRQLPRLAFSPRSGLLAATGDRGVVTLYDLAAGTDLTLCTLSSTIRDLAFSGDGEYLTIRSTGGTDAAALVVAVKEGRILHQEPAPGSNQAFFNNARLSPDHGRLYVSQQETNGPSLRCVDLSNGRTLWEKAGRDLGFSAMDLSPDGRLLVTGTGFRYTDIRVWNAATGELIEKLDGHSSWICQLSFASDGRTLASASEDQTIRLWDTATWQERAVLRGHTGVVRSIAFSSNGDTLASGSGDGSVMLWDLRKRKSQRASQLLPSWVEFATVLPGGAILARSSSNAWSVINLATLQTASLSFEADALVSFAPPSYLGAFDGKNRLRVYQATASGLRELADVNPGTSFRSVFAFLPEKRLLAWDDSTGAMYSAHLDELPKRTRLGSTRLGALNSARFTTDGRFLLAQGSIAATVFDVPAGVEAANVPLRLIPAVTGVNRPQLMGRQGEVMARLAPNGFLELRTLTDPRISPVQFPHQGAGNLAFSPDGAMVAVSAGAQGITLYDTHRQESLGVIHTFAFGLAFSPDGRRLVTTNGARDGQGMRLWDVATRQELLLLPANGALIYFAEFGDDGNTILAGSNSDGIFEFWLAPSLDEIEKAESNGGGWLRTGD